MRFKLFAALLRHFRPTAAWEVKPSIKYGVLSCLRLLCHFAMAVFVHEGGQFLETELPCIAKRSQSKPIASRNRRFSGDSLSEWRIFQTQFASGRLKLPRGTRQWPYLRRKASNCRYIKAHFRSKSILSGAQSKPIASRRRTRIGESLPLRHRCRVFSTHWWSAR